MPEFLATKQANLRQVLAALDGEVSGAEAGFKPLLLHIEITTRCNLRCLKCGHATDPPGTPRIMPRHLPFSIIDSFDDYFAAAACVHTFGYGEMFLYSRLHPLVDRLKHFECYVDGITNGVLVNRKEVDWLVECGYDAITFSIDGVEAATMQRLRGVDVEKIWQTLEYMKQRKRETGKDRPRVIVNFVAQSDNYHELPDLVRKLAGLGIYFLGINTLHEGLDTDANGAYGALYREFKLANAPRERVTAAIGEAVDLAHAAGISCAVYIDFDAQYREPATAASPAADLVQIAPSCERDLPAHAEKLQPYYCAYPWMAAYVHADGGARVCCYMEGALGTVRTGEEFATFWNQGEVTEVRAAIRDGDVHPACARCVKAGHYQLSFAQLESIREQLEIPERVEMAEDAAVPA
jgi:MoaA/NifB/PqqE/SkfB family radical SAM enzyme